MLHHGGHLQRWELQFVVVLLHTSPGITHASLMQTDLVMTGSAKPSTVPAVTQLSVCRHAH